MARRALTQAMELAGGADAWAARLKIARIPDRLFLLIVDVLQPQPKATDRGA